MRIDEILTSRDIMQKGDVDAFDFDDMIGHADDTDYRIDGYEIYYVDDNYDSVFLIKDPQSEGFLGELRLKPDGNFFKSTVKFAPELQGKGLAHKLYKLAIIEDNKTIVSDSTQSPGSRKLWQRLADEPGVFVYAWKPHTDEFFQWHPEEDPAEEVYKDEDKIQKLQNRYYEIMRHLRTLEQGSKEATNLENEMKLLTKEIDELKNIAYTDVRLVATREDGLDESLTEGLEPRQIEQSDIATMEDKLNQHFYTKRKAAGKVPLNIELGYHFLQRANDERNGEQVTIRELAQLFSKATMYADEIANMKPGREGVIFDRTSKINVAFVIDLTPDNELLFKVKTMMRKAKFYSGRSTKFVVETELDESFASTLTGMAGMLFKDKVYPQAADYMAKLALRDINKHNTKKSIQWYAHKINDMTPKHDLNIKMLIKVAQEQHPQIFQ